MKKFALLTIVLFLVSQISYATSGIYDAYLIYTLNGSGNTYIQAPNISTLVLNNPTSFTLKGGQIKTYKNNSSNVTGGGLQYRIYKQGDTAPGYSYSGGFTWTADLGNGDQSWEKNNDNVNILNGLTSGIYTLEIYFEAYTSDGNQYFNNAGANYKATIILYNKSISSGNWNLSDTWSEGIPTLNQLVMIESGHNVTLNTDATIANLTINAGGTFTASDASARLLTISKSTSGSSTTLANSGTWSNGTGGSSVIFNGSPNSGDATHVISGTIGFQNVMITKLGGSNNVGASFGIGSTIAGTLEIGAGGYVSTAPPADFYNSTAILKFNQGSAIYDVNAADNSWSTVQIPQNITISSGTVNLNSDRTATGNLLIDGGALVLNSNTPNLTINGNWTRSSGSFTANSGTVTLGGTTNGIVNVTGGATMNSLVISKTSGAAAKLACNLTTSILTINSGAILEINPAQQMTVSTTLTNSGTLTLKSDATGTATILTLGTSNISGTFKVEQHLSSARNWYISSPVAGATIPTGKTYFAYQEPGDNSVRNVQYETDYWKAYAALTELTVGKGYIAQPSVATTLEFTGTALNNGDKTVALTRTTGKTKEGFNLVGNPYPSHVTWTTDMASNANVSTTIWYRTYDSGYEFQTYNAAGTIGSPVEATPYIPPMQGFWVRVNSTAGGTLTFTNAMRYHKSSNPLKSKKIANTSDKILRLEISNGVNKDETVVYSNENALNTFDTYDSPKFSKSTVNPELYTVSGSEQLVINGMQAIPLDTEIPLGFRTQEANNFIIKTTEFSGFDSNVKVFIKDNQNVLNPEQELTPETSYNFSSDITDNSSRFSVIFKSAGVATGLCKPTDSDKITVFANENNQITVNLSSALSNSYSLEVYNSYGQKVADLATKNSTTTINKQLDAGVYFVKVNINEKISTRKVIIR